MKQVLSRLLSDYGMIIVLLLLCVVLSVTTYREQSPTGPSTGRQLAVAILSELGNAPRVLIAVRNVPDDVALAEALQHDLTRSGAKVLAVVRGEAKDARQAMEKIVASGNKLDVIAGTQESGGWLVFADLKTDFSALGEPRIVTPPSYYWPTFLTVSNLLNIADQVTIVAIIAIGMTIVIITGGIDLSVGSLVALSAVLATRLIRDFAGGMDATAVGMTLSCVAAIAICAMIGAMSAAMITRFDLPPFIVTLSIMLIGRGFAYRIAENQNIFQITDSFKWLAWADVFGLPNPVVLMFVLYGLAHVLMSRMRLGRYLYAVGGNREAARLSGVPVERVVIFAYAASAALAALGGVIMASHYKSGKGDLADEYELSVIAAVVVGGAPITGGEGKMFATLSGAFVIAVIQNGMNLMGLSPSDTQRIVLGFVILGAVLIGKIRRG